METHVINIHLVSCSSSSRSHRPPPHEDAGQLAVLAVRRDGRRAGWQLASHPRQQDGFQAEQHAELASRLVMIRHGGLRVGGRGNNVAEFWVNLFKLESIFMVCCRVSARRAVERNWPRRPWIRPLHDTREHDGKRSFSWTQRFGAPVIRKLWWALKQTHEWYMVILPLAILRI